MSIISTAIDLQEYIKKLERQKEVLKLSLVFNEKEKEQINECFNDLIEICNVKLTVQAIVDLEE